MMLAFDVIMDVLWTSEVQRSYVYVNNRFIEYNACRRNFSGFWLIFSIDVGDVKRHITYPNVTN